MKRRIIVIITVILLSIVIGKENIKKDMSFSVYINEVVSSNGSGYQDEDGDYVDWIELYNDSDKSISLMGFGLSDQKEIPKLWEFPDVEMPPKSYLLVCASGKNRINAANELHTNFKIDSSGESIYLNDPNGRLVSSLKIECVEFDKSFGYVETTKTYAELSDPTPNAQNSGKSEMKTRETNELEFSYAAGYYDDTIYLELCAEDKGAKIYYTLDGSLPTATSNFYNGEEIKISNRTSEKNKYTDIWCTPVDFWPGDGNTYSQKEQYKATVVKARLYFEKEDCWSEKIWTNTYLIGANYTMPIVALSVSEELLFDEQTGIYVPGIEFEKYMAFTEELPSDARLWNGNYSKDTKIIGYLEYFENGIMVMENDVTLRICGAASRGNAQKSLSVYAWDHSGEGQFKYSMFGEDGGNTFSSLRLRAFGNDWRRSMFRDALSQKLVDDLNLGTQAYQPCILLVNGEYFGVYEIRENRDEQFFQNHFGIRDKNLIKTELMDLTRENTDQYGNEFLDLIDFVVQNDLSLLENYEYVESKIDLEQFIDYVLVEQYLQNVDWPENNALVFRSKNKHLDSQYEDGKWRFVLYDLDYAINYPEENNYERILNSGSYISKLLGALLENEVFVQKYIERFEELLETHFEPSRALVLQEEFENEFAPEIEETLQRWNVYNAEGITVKEVTTEYWNEKMLDLRSFFIERPEYAKQYLAEQLYY